MATDPIKKQAASLGEFVYQPAPGETSLAKFDPLVELCSAFAAAMLEKLRLNEVKRAALGLSSNWQDETWQADCIAQLAEHVKKGDPRDTGILSAFCWFHGWHTGHVNGVERTDARADARQLLTAIRVQNTRPNATVGQLPYQAVEDLVTDLREQLMFARYHAIGDNHHNAIQCPYCNPDGLLLNEYTGKPRPAVVVLCGSTRFREAFELATERETLAGRVVLSVGNFTRDKEHALGAEVAAGLDELYKRKIEMSDEVLVLNVGGYIGKSTAGEIEHAKALGKRVRYWLDEMPSMSDPHNQAALAAAADVSPNQLELFGAPAAEGGKLIDLVPENCKGHLCNFMNSLDKAVCKNCPIAAMQPCNKKQAEAEPCKDECALYGGDNNCNGCPAKDYEPGAGDCGCEPGLCTQMPHNWCRLL